MFLVRLVIAEKMANTWKGVLDALKDSPTEPGCKSDPRMNRFLLKSPQEFGTILGVYIALLYFGPEFMRTKKALSLRKVLILYNILQILSNLYIFMRTLTVYDQLSIFCSPWAEEDNKNSEHILEGHYLFILLKYFDLIETLFFILRKKHRQISFLHIYHHLGILVGAWISGKYFPGGQAIYVALYNTLIHSIMYCYYLYASWSSSANIWWKKYVTVLQIMQHCLIFVSVFPSVFNKNCTYPKGWMTLFSFNVLVIIYLFSKFYKNTYLTKGKIE